jgi:glutathione S-transferase
MKLYSPPDNHVLLKIQFAARIANAQLHHEVVPYGHKNKQFQDHHALFTSPTLELSPGRYVFGTHAILRVLAPQVHELSSFQQVRQI